MTKTITAADMRMLRWQRIDPDLSDLFARVALHIGAAGVDHDNVMQCPACKRWDFGPTMTLADLAVYADGYLPGAPLLRGVCLDCEHATDPVGQVGPVGLWTPAFEPLRAAGRRRAYDLGSAPYLVDCPRCKARPFDHCVTDTGFVGGAGGPHAGRKKAVADWPERKILDGWDERRAHVEQCRADSEAWHAAKRAERDLEYEIWAAASRVARIRTLADLDARAADIAAEEANR